MSNGDFNWIVNCIRGIADDVLRGRHVCGRYRDVFPPKTVQRHLDAVLAEGKQAERAG